MNSEAAVMAWIARARDIQREWLELFWTGLSRVDLEERTEAHLEAGDRLVLEASSYQRLLDGICPTCGNAMTAPRRVE